VVSGLVELAGPAGAGKSSAFRTLLARTRNVEDGAVVRKREYAPVLATTVPGVLATLVRARVTRGLTREKVRSMVWLSTLPHVIERRPRSAASMLVFDQGPLYLLSEARLRDDRLAAWRKKTLETWGSLLDAVIWLDAPDAMLAERIDTRSEWHRLKGERLETATDVLSEARAAYEDMLSSLAARADGPAILRFDTSRASPDEVVDAILRSVEGFLSPVHSDPPPDQLPLCG
jgi:thymidylate kinase